MSNINIKQDFLLAAESWVCDGYSVDIRFVADSGQEVQSVWSLLIVLSPLPPSVSHEFIVETEKISVGQIQKNLLSKNDVLKILNTAADGLVETPSTPLRLISERPLYFYSEMAGRDRWFYQMHLQVSGDARPMPNSTEKVIIDNQLRLSSPPFDGLVDVVSWLGLGDLDGDSIPAIVQIRVNPPVDLIFDACCLSSDQLRLTLHAHPQFDTQYVGLAVRASPGISIETRRQVAKEIIWDEVKDGVRKGVVTVVLENADSVLAILMIGSDPVRRQWFVDSTKARNNRFLAIQHFDEDLRMIRKAVLDEGDGHKFEKGISSLLFLLGFSPSIQLETDSPDLIVTTPGGRLIIVECTIRVADFSAKVGKLVDRRGSLIKALHSSGHPADVASVLVCRLPRSQIVAEVESLKTHKVILITEEDLLDSFDRVRHQNNPDEILQEAEALLFQSQEDLFR